MLSKERGLYFVKPPLYEALKASRWFRERRGEIKVPVQSTKSHTHVLCGFTYQTSRKISTKHLLMLSHIHKISSPVRKCNSHTLWHSYHWQTQWSCKERTHLNCFTQLGNIYTCKADTEVWEYVCSCIIFYGDCDLDTVSVEQVLVLEIDR